MAIKKPLLFKPKTNALAFGFGAGLISFAPGTWGTLVAIPLYLLIAGFSDLAYGLVVVVGFVLGIRICEHAVSSINLSSGQESHDHPAIVWDEIIGFLVTMFFIPVTFWNIVLGFLLFRVFDILKPWPIRWIDRKVSGGFGIMLDDIVAGIFANLAVHLVLAIVV